MNANNNAPTYKYISQRAVDSYRKALVPFESATTDAQTESRRQLHGFFATLYDFMYENPAGFGMSIAEDDCLEGHEQGGDHNNTVRRKLNQQRKKIAAAIVLLRGFGECGMVENERLRIPIVRYREIFTTTPKVLAKCLDGLRETGLSIEELSDDVVIGSKRFPEMMTALSELAQAQINKRDEKLGYVYFARCDYRSLHDDYEPGVESIFSYFEPEVRNKAMELHEFMLETRHTADFELYGVHEWELDYQGPRRIKSTQLIRVRYDDRYRNSGLIYVLCAAANRLVPHFADQPKRVQDDFRNRISGCDPNCNWCDSKKGLNPSEFEGRTICWNTSNPARPINDESTQIVRDYVRWHDALA
jgi:hypothetical protein